MQPQPIAHVGQPSTAVVIRLLKLHRGFVGCTMLELCRKLISKSQGYLFAHMVTSPAAEALFMYIFESMCK